MRILRDTDLKRVKTLFLVSSPLLPAFGPTIGDEPYSLCLDEIFSLPDPDVLVRHAASDILNDRESVLFSSALWFITMASSLRTCCIYEKRTMFLFVVGQRMIDLDPTGTSIRPTG